MKSLALALRSLGRLARLNPNVDGSTRLVVFCLANYRCAAQCPRCLYMRSHWRLVDSGLMPPRVIYLGNGSDEEKESANEVSDVGVIIGQS